MFKYHCGLHFGGGFPPKKELPKPHLHLPVFSTAGMPPMHIGLVELYKQWCPAARIRAWLFCGVQYKVSRELHALLTWTEPCQENKK